MFTKNIGMLKVVLIVNLIFLSILASGQVVSLDNIGGYLGKNVTVFGKVQDGRYLTNSTRQPTLLNMGGRYPNQKLTVVIYGDNRVNFGYKPEETLIGKDIYVSGRVDLYNGKPQIVVQNPFSISFSAPNASSSVGAGEKAPGNSDGKDNRERKGLGKIFRKAEDKQERPAVTPTASPVVKEERRQPAVKEERRQPVVKEEPKPVKQERKPAAKEERKQPVITLETLPSAKTGDIVTKSNINLKAGPGNDFISVGTLRKGTTVTVISSSYGWSKVAEKTPLKSARALVGYLRSENLD